MATSFIPDLRQLRSFVALAESGSFTTAAKNLRLTQSAISHSVRSLEEALTTKLVDRHGKRSVLTREGELIYQTASRVLSDLESSLSEIESLRKWGQGRIRVGMTHALCHHLLPTVLREFRDCFAHCEVTVEAGDTASLLGKLDNSEIDLAIGLELPDAHGVEFSPLFMDELVIAVAPHHDWAGGQIKTEEGNSRHQLILYSRQSETFRLVNQFFDKLGARLKSPMVLGDMEAIKSLAMAGIGGGVIASWFAKAEFESGKLVALPFKNPSIRRTWGCYLRTKRKLSLVEETFVGVCEMAGKNLEVFRPAAMPLRKKG